MVGVDGNSVPHAGLELGRAPREANAASEADAKVGVRAGDEDRRHRQPFRTVKYPGGGLPCKHHESSPQIAKMGHGVSRYGT